MKTLNVPTPTLVGREELYTQTLYSRFRPIGIKNTFIAEYGTKTIFSNFVFYSELSEFKFCEYSTVFVYIFRNFFAKNWLNLANIT